MSHPLADAQARATALDPAGSFIVQAPAGSGKTGLLTQRFLRLLALVNQPEELVAITFTRKAAAEMRHRIIAALQSASGPPPDGEDPFAHHTWHLAERALRRDREQAWQLLENSGRLRVLTMDALCAHITRQLPILSRLGGDLDILDDPWEAYQWAARATLESGKEANRWGADLATLLDHLDNHRPKVESLLAQMLARREQWLRHVTLAGSTSARPQLEAVLRQVIHDGLHAVEQRLSPLEMEEIGYLMTFAANNLRRSHPQSPLTRCQAEFPSADPEQLEQWLAVVEFLLTKKDEWRKQVIVSNGFPPASQARSPEERALFAEMKACTLSLLEILSQKTGLREALATLRLLPPPHYTDGQWRILQALLHLLPMAVAQLHLRFQEWGKVDFTEISMRAGTALGETDSPTQLALKLDYQIKHLLVDEFQDTSQGHFRLLERLTGGWSGEDGRTLFVVGDPMQSIYRFREADVGLFLRAQQQGIGMIALQPLALTVNFRSQAGLVAWVNETFAPLFPQEEAIDVGAVPFHPAVAVQPPLAGAVVTVQPLLGDACQEEEAAQVVALARQARQAGEQTAILVRARSHLQHILPALQQAGLRYQGIDLESLSHSMVIQDLFSLTRALLCPADRLAWLAVLRAPWCGLSLADLTALSPWSPEQPPTTLWERIQAADDIPLSAEGQQRLQRLKEVLESSIRLRQRCNAFPGSGTLRFWIEQTWQALGGAATVPDPRGLGDAQRFFALLAASERGGTLPDLPTFARRVASLYSGVDEEADGGLWVMTIHKAKGLEFDTVIVPGLGHAPRGEERRLLAWMEHPAGLLLGPLKRVDQEQDDPIHTFIRHTEKRKASLEAGRLLYVAVTRARRHLHLLGHVKEADSPPASASFLHALWPRVHGAFAQLSPSPPPPAPAQTATGGTLRRLASGWVPPPPPPPLRAQVVEAPLEEEPVLFEWAGETVRLVGIVVHRFLHIMAQEGVHLWTPARIESRRAAITAHLERLGVPQEPLAMATGLVSSALLKTVADQRGMWILDNRHHQEAASELALTGILQGRVQRLVLDRTFVDQEGVRWIVDFKTSLHQGGDLPAFLDNEQIRYREQMHRYATLMQRLTAHPIRLGLYFPMHAGWRSWEIS
ncbi:MAG: UvrD-helicase domain-containing protein [Magnetococcales bacterium]|nr:UvrD-helicase domain-containing protein [Magnetococcales bacterium]